MTPSRQEPGLFYRCSWYQRRKGSRGEAHTAMGYAGAIAEEALLREVRRLRPAPRTPQTERRRTNIAEIPALLDRYLTQGDDTGLRLLMREIVASARIVERLPQRQPKWLRAEVTWQPEIRLLLEAGVVQLAAPDPAPEQSARAERRREAQRRYSARRRQGLTTRPKA